MRLDHRAILGCSTSILSYYIAQLNNFWALETDPRESKIRYPKGIVDNEPTVPQAKTKHIWNLNMPRNRCTDKSIVGEDGGVDIDRLKALDLRAAHMNDSTETSNMHII